MSERVILAYSGGLDTSVAISWIGKETGREVVAVAIDLGQGGEDMEVIRQRALDCGAVEAVVVDARDEFAEQVRIHSQHINELFGQRPRVFRNTELIYNNDLAHVVARMGFKGVMAEGADRVLGYRSPTYLYHPVGEPNLRRQSAWRPDGAGFARVSVIDARGATDSILVRVE